MTKHLRPTALIHLPELMRMLGLKSRQTVYELLRDDPTFPRARRQGARRIAWVLGEVEAYIEALPIAQFDGLGAVRRKSEAEREPA